MEDVAKIAIPIIFLLIIVCVPLSILRSLDEIKQSQRRIEGQLAVLEERLSNDESRV